MSEKIAIFDLGSNTFKLLIAEKTDTPEGFIIIHKEESGVKLASEGINKNIITENARLRALAAIASFKVTAEDFECRNFKCTGTSAFRDAKNGQVLVDEIKERFHLDVEIISGDREAQLIHKGVSLSYKLNETPVLIMDIGGGSLEIIIANNTAILFQHSYNLGMRRIMEKLEISDPLNSTEIKKITTFFNAEFNGLDKVVKKLAPKTLVGTSGSYETISKLIEKQKKKPLRKVGNASYKLSRSQIEKIHDKIIPLNTKQRSVIPGMDLIRVDLIAIAMVVVHHIIKKFNFDNVVFSTYALKEGLLKEVLEQE